MTPLPYGAGRSACMLVAATALLGSGAGPLPSAPGAGTPADGAPKSTQAAGRDGASLEERYVLGPAAADDFGLRVVWQAGPLVTRGSAGQCIGHSADSVWFADAAGSVVRLRGDNGETVWRGSTNTGLERILALEHLPAGPQDRVYAVTEFNSITMDAATGALVRRSSFSHLPSQVPSVYGPSLVYGTRTGLCCWFQYGPGFNWRAASLGGNILAPVTMAGQMILVGSTSGSIYAMDASTAAISWTRHLAAGVEARIAADDKACYVAGIDQSVWAFDLFRGRVLWQHFTETPLRSPPARVGDGLYVQIPGEGLVAFTPIPKDKPDGEIRWKSSAAGNVEALCRGQLFAWDRAARALTAIDPGSGRVIRTANFPKAQEIRFTAPVDGDVIVMSGDGLVERLAPVAAPSAPTASASIAPAP